MTNDQNVAEAALLYRDVTAPDFDDLQTRLNASLAQSGLGVQRAPIEQDSFALYSHKDYHILVSFNDAPLGPQGFEIALSAPICVLRKFDYAAAVKAHRQTICVTVGNGPMHLNDQVRAYFDAAGMDIDEIKGGTLPLEGKLIALNAAVQALCGIAEPDVVHWQQSDMLFSMEEVALARDRLMPIALMVHPSPLMGPKKSDGRRELGVRLLSAHHFVGKTLMIDANPRPFNETLNIGLSLIIEHRAGRCPLNHGDQLQASETDIFYVSHEDADEDDPMGRICIGFTPPEGTGDADIPVTPIALRSPAEMHDGITRAKGAAPQPRTETAAGEVDPETGLPMPDMTGLATARRNAKPGKSGFKAILPKLYLPGLAVILVIAIKAMMPSNDMLVQQTVSDFDSISSRSDILPLPEPVGDVPPAE